MDMQRTTQSLTPDGLLAGEGQVTDAVTILSGEGAVSRGQLLGKISHAAGTPGAGTNTGNGTVTGVSLGGKARLGTYTLKCITAAANGGTFKVIDPDGYALDALATVGTPFTNAHLNVTINDGSADFIVGDSFTIAVAAGSGKYRGYNAANVDGSQYPSAILAEDVDATSSDKPAAAYFAGRFSGAAIIGYTASLKDALRLLGVIVKTIGA
jgi:hypothetical protein